MSTDYTHFTKLAFDTLFAKGPEGQESQIYGTGGFLIPVLAPNGVVGAPAFSFIADPTSGMWVTGGFLSFSALGNLRFQISQNNIQAYQTIISKTGGTAASPCYTFGDSLTTGTLWDTGTSTYQISVAGTSVFKLDGSGDLTLNSGIVGTATNNNATAGNVGEAVRANIVVGSAITIATTVTWQNITSISLTAGDWDVSGIAGFGVGTGTSLLNVRGAISINSGTTITDQVWGDNMISSVSIPTSNGDTHLNIPSYRLSLSGTTTVYLKGYCSFGGGAPVFYGRISARRVR